jgi:transposase-like protein
VPLDTYATRLLAQALSEAEGQNRSRQADSSVGRGLRTPTSVTSDGAPGLVNAIEGAFSKSLRIRCWYHKLGNIRSKLPAEGAEEVLAHARAVRDAPTHEAGEAQAASLIECFGELYPAAVKSFADDLEGSLAHLKVPVRHRINVRTTNLLERSFLEERRRTKVIPRLMDEKSAMKLSAIALSRAVPVLPIEGTMPTSGEPLSRYEVDHQPSTGKLRRVGRSTLFETACVLGQPKVFDLARVLGEERSLKALKLGNTLPGSLGVLEPCSRYSSHTRRPFRQRV